MKRLLTLATLALCAVAAAGTPPVRLGLSRGAQSSSGGDPTTLPLLTDGQIATSFVFEGSFLIPSTWKDVGSAMSVNQESVTIGGTTYPAGTLLYDTAKYVNPMNSAQTIPGLGVMLLPTITPGSGTWTTPAYNGSNGTATNVVSPARPIITPGTSWTPSYPWGVNNGDVITGSGVYNGKLYITGGPYYDTGCNSDLGWILETDPTTPGSGWGTVNTIQGQAAEYSKRFAGPIGIVPTEWQPYLGGPLFVASGPGLGGISCNVPIGFSFYTFDPSNVSPTGAAVPVTELQDYFYVSGGIGPSSAYATQLSSRSFSGPFPLAGGGGSTYTLTAAPTAGATSATLASAFSETTGTAYYIATFSDGEKRLVHMKTSSTSFPGATASSCDPTVFVATTWTPSISGTSCNAPTADPLTCSPSCTTSVIFNPVGDNRFSDYDGPVGTPFIMPNTRTLVYVSFKQYGPHSGAPTDSCFSGASGSNHTPISPDTGYYIRIQLTLFDLNDLIAAKNGTGGAEPWSANPYDWNLLPQQTGMASVSGCYQPYYSGMGWVAYDPTNERLYLELMFSTPNTGTTQQRTIFVYKVTPP